MASQNRSQKGASRPDKQKEKHPLTLSETARKFDITERTLRHYEYIELVVPPKEGRKRLYGPKEFARITLVLRGRKSGFSLEQTRQWLLMYETEGLRTQLEIFVNEADKKIAELNLEKRKLDESINEIKKLRAQSLIEIQRAKLDKVES